MQGFVTSTLFHCQVFGGVFFPKCIYIISMRMGHGKITALSPKTLSACLQPVGRVPPPRQTSCRPQCSATKANPNPTVSLCFPDIQPCFLSSPKMVSVLGKDAVVGAKPWPPLSPAGPCAGFGTWVWGCPRWAAGQMCLPGWQRPGLWQQEEVKAAL